MKIGIIGAGMAGLLAANMLRQHLVTVFERQKSLPNNHSSLLRFRTDAVSRELRMPFRKVKVFKQVAGSQGPVADAIRYSRKVLPDERLELRSIIDVSPAERFIAPFDLVSQMRENVKVIFSQDINKTALEEMLCGTWGAFISTIPMPLLMNILEYDGPRPRFHWRDGGSLRFSLDADIFATVYIPGDETLCYRASITGDQFIAEWAGLAGFLDPPKSGLLLSYFGLDENNVEIFEKEIKVQAYAKINYLSEEDRRKAETFMMWASVNHKIFSLGRFATWRAGLLLDDLVHDIEKIEGWINSGSYLMMKEMTK